MAGPKGELETLRLNFLKKRFSRYFAETDIPEPLKIENREFGVITERGGMWRHLALENHDKMAAFMRKQVPLHAYHSSAYYEKPGEKFMDEKVWLGADLVFDLDADHIEGAETMGLEEQLAAVKNEFRKLLDNFLLDHFGLDEKHVQIVFSGGRGYHAHVRDPRVLSLNSHERREIVDYITLPDAFDIERLIIKKPLKNKSYKQHGSTEHTYHLPDVNSTGWKGLLRKGVIDFIKEYQEKDKEEAIKELRSYQGIGKQLSEVIWKELFDEKTGRANLILNDGNLEAFSENINRNRFVEFILNKLRVEMPGETDEPVTADVKRLIRLPGTLHGKSGLVVRKLELSELDGFDPLRDAVWDGFSDEAVKITGKADYSIRLKGEEFVVSEGGETEVPEFAAVFFLGQKRADMTIS